MFIGLIKISIACAAFIGATAFASGYEKAVLFGGRTAGIAGISSPYIQGPQSLYFNPAGLVSDKLGMGVDVDITALQSQFKGPIDVTNEPIESEKKTITPFGVFYGITTDEKMGFGFGVYSSAGSHAKFEDVTIASQPGNKVETDLRVIEVAGGLGYRVMEHLKVGLAYRILLSNGNFAFVQRGGATTAINAEVNDLKGMDYLSYKIGAQYDLNENTKLGFTYRGQTDLVLKGKFGGTVRTAGPQFAIDENAATIKTTLPQAVTLGVAQKFGPTWNAYGEYVWTQYSRVEHVTIDGDLTRSGGTPISPGGAEAPDLEQHWKDQHQFKIAGEYLGLKMPVRIGYIWTSQVTDDDFARASFTAPGNGHTVTLGTAYAFNEKMTLDGAMDYTVIKGTGNGAAAGSLAGDIRAGEHTTTATALHLGFSYNF